VSTAPWTEPSGSRRGADMGRPSCLPTTFNRRLVRLQRVPVDRGGYDPGGAYWGHQKGMHLWCAWQGTAAMYLRAPDRETAKAIVEASAPRVTFYR
jgi:hypothetical protein